MSNLGSSGSSQKSLRQNGTDGLLEVITALLGKRETKCSSKLTCQLAYSAVVIDVFVMVPILKQ